jgi:urea transport system ATP-binding protein
MRLNRERGITVILVEQNVVFARRAATRFAFLEKGRVVANGTISELSDELIQRHLAV